MSVVANEQPDVDELASRVRDFARVLDILEQAPNSLYLLKSQLDQEMAMQRINGEVAWIFARSCHLE